MNKATTSIKMIVVIARPPLNTLSLTAANQCSGDCSNSWQSMPSRLCDIIFLSFFQESRSPVETSVTLPCSKQSIGNSNVPKHLVVEYVLEENLLCGKHFFLLLAIVFRIVVTVFLNSGKPARLRGYRESGNMPPTLGEWPLLPGTPRTDER